MRNNNRDYECWIECADNSIPNDRTIVSTRSPVRFPWWTHLIAILVFSLNCAKIPRAINLVNSQFQLSPLSAESNDTKFQSQAVAAGAVIFCLLSGILGALFVYIVHRNRVRARSNRRSEAASDISMWELVVALALTLPDFWFILMGSNPYTSWQFLSLYATIILISTLWKGSVKNLFATIPCALLIGFAL